MPINTYVASVARHAKKWRIARDNMVLGPRIKIISSWIDHIEDEPFYFPSALGKAWEKNLAEIRTCDMLLAYWERSDKPLRGALVEVGVALSIDKPVIVCGDDIGMGEAPWGTWHHHPKVVIARFLDDVRSHAELIELT